MIALVVFTVLVASGLCQKNPCEGQPDGAIPEWGCESYTICYSGLPEIVDCDLSKNEAFNNYTGQCEPREEVPPPCGYQQDCTGVPDGRYPEYLDNCHSYYICLDEIYFGHIPCNPGLVFNYYTQQCDWPENVPPPCGTAEVSTAAFDYD